MTTPHAKGHLIRNTGIGQGQYVWWESKEACDQWFLKKAAGIEITDYSRIYGEPQSNKDNVACVHVNAPLSKTVDCDYFSYFNDDAGRWFHAAIIGREFVSDSSCRLHFTIDYVATYFDTLKFKQCWVERITTEDAPYQNLLPEPIAVQVVESPVADPFEAGADVSWLGDLNQVFDDISFVVNTDMNQEGQVNEPETNYVSGYPYGGYIKVHGDLNGVKNQVKGIIQRVRNLLSKTTATAATVQSIVAAPTMACQLGADRANGVGAVMTCPSAGKWNKTKNYQYMKIISGSGQVMEIKPINFGTATIPFTCYFYGGVSGHAELCCVANNNSFALKVASPPWAQISFAGTGADGQTVLSNTDSINRGIQSVVQGMLSSTQ